MDNRLRPLNLGEILDRTVQLYRRNFWLFVGTGALPVLAALNLAIPAAVLFLIPGIASGDAVDPAAIVRGVALGVTTIVFLLVYFAAFTFSIAALTEATVSVDRGEKLTIRAALRSSWPRFWTYFWLLLLQIGVVGIAPIGVATALIRQLVYLMTRPGVDAATSFALGFLVFLVGTAAIGAVVWLALSLAMSMAVCVVEKKTAWESIVRAWRLSQRTRGRIFVLYLLVVALSMAVSMAGYLLAATAGAAAAFVGRGSAVAIALTVVAGFLYIVVGLGAQIALAPVPWIALVLFYNDQRVRKEGYDIEWMMQQAGLVPPQAASEAALELGELSAATPLTAESEVFPQIPPPDNVGER